MAGIPSPFSDDTDDSFDDYDEFVPAHNPTPGTFLEGQAVLDGSEHVDFHDLTRELFEERGVYDVTFGYNLARLNLDRRHPDAGFRYAEERGSPGRRGDAADLRAREGREHGREQDGRDERVGHGDRDGRAVLRAEFTPTTPFCPQSLTLTKGAFRAWNGLSERHEYDLVRVRLDECHHESDSVNETLRTLEGNYRANGTISDGASNPAGEPSEADSRSSDRSTGGPRAPF